MDVWMYEHVGWVEPRWGGVMMMNDERQGVYIRCRIVESIRGERRRWKVISMVSSGIESVRGLHSFGDARRCDAKVCPVKEGHPRKTEHIY